MTVIRMPYGKEECVFDVPERNLLGVFGPQDIEPVPDPLAELCRALDEPIGGPPIEQLARGAKHVTIVADDNTRPTRTDQILPLILDRLNAAGVPDARIRVIIALGTHRKMTEAEIGVKFGRAVTERVAVINHEIDIPEQLIDLGVTPGGVSVQVNRTVMESDLVLGVGSIVPHHIPGFSGGSKIIQPGVCGARTTGQVHLLSVRHPYSLLGRIENQVRQEMEVIAAKANLKAIVNTVLDPHQRLIGAVYGEPRAAFRRGCAISRSVYGVNVPQEADIVIAGSHPCDIEFWQAHKTLYAGELCVRSGGTIIVVTPCPEGLAVTHPDMVDYAGKPKIEIETMINSGQIHDLTAGALSLAWANTRERSSISLVSHGIAPDVARSIGFEPFDSVATALAAALRQHGSEATISVLPYAPDTLPILP